MYSEVGRTAEDQSHGSNDYVWGLRGPVVQIYNTTVNIFPNFAMKITNCIKNYWSKDSQENKSGKLGPDRSESVGAYEQKDTVYRWWGWVQKYAIENMEFYLWCNRLAWIQTTIVFERL